MDSVISEPTVTTSSLAQFLNRLISAPNLDKLNIAYYKAIESHPNHHKMLKVTYKEMQAALTRTSPSAPSCVNLAQLLSSFRTANDLHALNDLFHEAIQSHPQYSDLIGLVYSESKSALEGKPIGTKMPGNEKKVRQKWLISFVFLFILFLIGLFFLSYALVAYKNFSVLLETSQDYKSTYEIVKQQGYTSNDLFQAVFSNKPEVLVDFTSAITAAIFPVTLASLLAWFFYYCSYKKKGVKLLSWAIFSITTKLLHGCAIYLTEAQMWYCKYGFQFVEHIFPVLSFGVAIYFVIQCFQLRNINKELKSDNKSKELKEVFEQLQWQPQPVPS